MRIGHAWDVHRLVGNRPLILGGIEIPYSLGLLGHSDADVLLHAIAEALLGSLALGDLGTFFPDNDVKYKDMDSKIILMEVYKMIQDKGYKIVNIDSTIYAEAPKLRPYIDEIRKSISNVLNIPIEDVSVKATTHEMMGSIGKKEAISSEAVVLIEKKK